MAAKVTKHQHRKKKEVLCSHCEHNLVLVSHSTLAGGGVGSSIDTLDDIRLASAAREDGLDVEAHREGGSRLWVEKSRKLLPHFVVEKLRKPVAVAAADHRTGMELIPLSERKRKGQNVAISETTTTDDLAAADEDKKRNKRKEDLRVYFTMILICIIAAIVTMVKIALEKLIASGYFDVPNNLTINKEMIATTKEPSITTEALPLTMNI